jgi:hypothetical protein
MFKNKKSEDTDDGKEAIPERRKKATRYHNAAVNAISEYLYEDNLTGDVELTDEHRLSEDALRIDMMIIKKNRGVAIKRVWGKFMREVNILEYKSPAGPAPSLRVFDKVVHGYAGIYAAQNNIDLTDMTATLICARKPVKLFKELENKRGYKILREGDGIYYIRQRGVAVEKTLAVQVVVSSELPDSEILLKALKPDIDEETARKVAEIIDGDADERLSVWTEAVLNENANIILREGDIMRMTKLEKALIEHGYVDRWRQEGEMKGRQEGWEEGLIEGKKSDARAMLADGMDVATIARITGLTADEIRLL